MMSKAVTPDEIRDLVRRVRIDGWTYENWMAAALVICGDADPYRVGLGADCSLAIPDWSINLSASAALMPPGYEITITRDENGVTSVLAERGIIRVRSQAPTEAMARWMVAMLARAREAELSEKQQKETGESRTSE